MHSFSWLDSSSEKIILVSLPRKILSIATRKSPALSGEQLKTRCVVDANQSPGPHSPLQVSGSLYSSALCPLKQVFLVADCN